jgi:hypothetical protein
MVVLPDRTVVPPAVSNEWHRRGRSTVFYESISFSANSMPRIVTHCGFRKRKAGVNPPFVKNCTSSPEPEVNPA